MSWLGPGTKVLHNSDWGHNHLLGNGTSESDEFWKLIMAKHMAEHRKHYDAGTDTAVPQGWHRWEDFPS